MDVKELNKSQLLMLAILISFITSIATGIVTVTLMQQAPSSVTTPMNRIVRQTVEKIVPGEITNNTQTVVVKEEDLVVDAIAKNQKALFIVYGDSTDEAGVVTEVNYGKGIVVSTDGIIVVDASNIFDKGNYFVKNDSGKFKATFVSADKNGFSFLKIGEPVNGKDKVSFIVPIFGDITKMKAGQKIIVLGSSIASFIFDGSKDLKLNGAKSNAGAPILDLDGNILGIALSGDSSFVPIGNVTDALKSLKA